MSNISNGYSSISLGVARSFPKLKSNLVAEATPLKQKQATNNLIKFSKKAIQILNKRPRILSHVGLVAVIGIVVFLGSSTRSGIKTPIGSQVASGYGAYLDNAAVASVAATIADKTDLLVAKTAVQTADSLNTQVALATSGDDFLSKNSTVATEGDVNRGISTYKVISGDTVASVALNFNVTTDTIRWANNLSADAGLVPGQELAILPTSGLLYTVQSGDTPQILAMRFRSDAEQIISFNNAEITGLVPGQNIIIPDGVRPEANSQIARSNQVGLSGNGYSYGYCTYYVAGRRSIPSNWGNAGSWYYNAQLSGYGVGRTPRPGAVAWTSSGYYGHVSYVEQVAGDQVLVSEMNYASSPGGGWNRVSYRWVPYSTFLYIY